MGDQIKCIPVNRTLVFTCPLSDSEQIVRTGVLTTDNNSFIHAILSAYSKDYYNMQINNKINFFHSFKKTLYPRSAWEKISSNNEIKLCISTIKEHAHTLYSFIKKVMSSDKDDLTVVLSEVKNRFVIKLIKDIVSKNLAFYDLMTDLITEEDINVLIPENAELTNLESIMLDNIKTHLNSLSVFRNVHHDRIKFIQRTIEFLFKIIIEQSIYASYKAYIHSIKTLEPTVDTLKTISDAIKCNIFIIDSVSRLPVETSIDSDYPESILILKIQESYEVLGNLLPGNKIKRKYTNDDSVINRIRRHLNYEESVPDIEQDNASLLESDTPDDLPNDPLPSDNPTSEDVLLPLDTPDDPFPLDTPDVLLPLDTPGSPLPLNTPDDSLPLDTPDESAPNVSYNEVQQEPDEDLESNSEYNDTKSEPIDDKDDCLSAEYLNNILKKAADRGKADIEEPYTSPYNNTYDSPDDTYESEHEDPYDSDMVKL